MSISIYKEKGNELFKEENYMLAIENYSKAITLHKTATTATNIPTTTIKIPTPNTTTANKNETVIENKNSDKNSNTNNDNQSIVILLCNRAACYLKTVEYSLCINDCDNALRILPDTVKAYFRRAKAKIGTSIDM